MLRRRTEAGWQETSGTEHSSPPADTPQVSALASAHPRSRPPRRSPISPVSGRGTGIIREGRSRRCDTVRASAGIAGGTAEPRHRCELVYLEPRLPPFRFAFLSRLSYWCDIRCAWIWAMKSITTTTTINNEVPPK